MSTPEDQLKAEEKAKAEAEAKADELQNSSQPKSSISSTKNVRAVNDNKQPRVFAKKLREVSDNVKDYYKESFKKNVTDGRIGAAFSNAKQRDLQDELSGAKGTEAQRKAEAKLDEAMRAFKAAKGASGSSSWLDVMDPVCKLIQAYIELRIAQGKDPDSFMGRLKAIALGPSPLGFLMRAAQAADNGASEFCELMDAVFQPNELNKETGNDERLASDNKQQKDGDDPDEEKASKKAKGDSNTSADPASTSNPPTATEGTTSPDGGHDEEDEAPRMKFNL